MGRAIFINLPVANLDRSIAFYQAIGATREPKFSNDKAAMMRFSDDIAVMLLTHGFYKSFTSKPIADAARSSEVLLCLSCDSRQAVDAMVAAAAGSGGQADPGPKQDMSGMMFGRSFEDPDGHHWEPMWMDPQFAEQGAHAAEQADA